MKVAEQGRCSTYLNRSSATPSQPRSVPKIGYKSGPVLVNASPSTASMPEYLVTKPRASMQTIAATAGIMRRTVPAASRVIRDAGTPSKKPLATAARKTAVPVADNGTSSSCAFS